MPGEPTPDLCGQLQRMENKTFLFCGQETGRAILLGA
jgi:hypothetical protein